MVPSGLNCRFETFAPGLLNCGRFVTLNASSRICMLTARPSPICRKTPRSQLAYAGPAQDVIRRGAEAGLGDRLERHRIEVGVAAADAAENLDVVSTWSARWSFDSGAFSDVPAALTVNGVPL